VEGGAVAGASSGAVTGLPRPAPSRIAAAAALAACCLAGALLNLTRAAWWTPWAGFTWRPGAIDARFADDHPLTIGAFKRLLVPVPPWRPLAVTLDVRAEVPQATLSVESPLDGVRVRQEVDTSARARVVLVVRAPAGTDGRLPLQADSRSPSGRGVVLESIRVAPVFAAWPLARHGALGALVGAAFWLLAFGWRVWSREVAAPGGDAGARTDPRLERRAAAGAAGLVLAVLGPWTVLKPPLQAPDEPQHIVRATSMRLGPWVGGVQDFVIDTRHLIALSWGPSPILDGLIGRPERYLTREQVSSLEAYPQSVQISARRVVTAHASYPPVLYWFVFGIAWLARAAALSPWQTLYALRLAVAALSALLWGGVFLTMRRDPDFGTRAPAALALFAGIPMYAYLGSSVNPDAIAIPLTIWLAVLCWQGATRGPRPVAIGSVALLLLLTKPSGIQVVPALIAAAAACAWKYPESRRRAIEVARILALVGLVSYVLFYAWSPPALSDAPGLQRSLPAYLADLPARLPGLWVMLWGQLGWLDYRAPAPCYAAVALAVAACVWGWARRGRDTVAREALFFGAFGIVLVASTLGGEFVNLDRTGYMLQGRYFLPCAVCLLPVLARAPRIPVTLLLGAVWTLHAALAWLTLTRYWNGDLGVWVASLPF
jgi:hypothetical protein